MIKIKDLRAMAHAANLKLSESNAFAEADRLACMVVQTAIMHAKDSKSPKLEGKHFDGITVLNSKQATSVKRAYGIDKKRRT